MALSKQLKRDSIYVLVRLLLWAVNVLPRKAALFVGALLGSLTWHLVEKERHKTLRTLATVLGPRLSAAERSAIGRRFYINAGKNIIDFLRFERHYETEIRPLVTVTGREHFDRAYQRGNGMFGVTGHIGHFELLAVHMAALGYRIAAIGRELHDRRLDAILVRQRRAMNLTNIYTTDSPRRLVEWLKGGGAVGVLIDTDSHRVRSTFVPAFGRPSQTPIGQSLLALRVGAALVPIACVRRPDDSFEIVVRPEVIVPQELTGEEAARWATAACTREIENIIRTDLAQWPWRTNRWKTPVTESA